MHGRSVVVCHAVGVCGALISASLVMASQGPPPVLNPKTYTSPSGEYRLEVDPSTMYGQDGGTYRFTRRGQELWSGTRAFTLWDCAVTDDGVAAGYAYSRGWAGLPVSKPGSMNWGSFHVLIFESDGTLRLNEITKRDYDGTLHAPPNPIAMGMFVNSQSDRFVVRIRGPCSAGAVETWWSYQLSTGKRLAKMQPTRPSEAKAADVTVARTIPGTPLTLLQWWPSEDKPGGVFTVADVEGKPVWTLVVPQDYVSPGENAAKDQILWSFLHDGAVLSVGEGPRFDLQFVREKKRVTFAVEPYAGGERRWKISEVGRVDYADPGPVDPLADIPAIALKQIGTITLGAQATARPAIRGVRDFDFDRQGRIGFIRQDSDASVWFVLVEPDGKVACETRVDDGSRDPHPWFRAAWVSEDRWIVTSCRDGKSRGWWLDTDKSDLRPIEGFDCPLARKLAGTRDGGFIALTQGNYSEGGIIAFDHDGKRRWHGGSEHSGRALINFSEDVAVTSDGRVAVISSSDKAIQLLDQAGKYLETIDLKKSFGQKPSYPTEIAADLNGGMVVGDFGGSPPVWRLKANGKVAAKFQPRYEDGRKFPLLAGVKVAPDGRLWACDGEALLRLKDDGVVDLVLGPKPDADELGEMATVALDPAGRIYAVSQRTSAIHVFESDGRPIRVLKPLATDYASNSAPENITIAASGDVYVAAGLDGKGYLQYGNDGKRVGFKKLGLDCITEEWCFRPGTQERWLKGYHEVYLVDDDGKVRRTISRRPNRDWLDLVGCLGVAPDGAIVVAASDAQLSQSIHPTINLYSRDGAPLRTIAIPEGSLVYRLAYDGRLIVVSLFSKLLFVSADGSSLQQVALTVEHTEHAAWQPFFSPDGKELWLFPAKGRAIERFELPKTNIEKPGPEQEAIGGRKGAITNY